MNSIGKSSRLLSAAILSTLFASGVCAQQRTFDLPEQEAVKSIPEFARQAGIQISAPTGELHGTRTPRIQGDYDVRTALNQLIEATGLEIASDDGSMIVLRKARVPVQQESAISSVEGRNRLRLAQASGAATAASSSYSETDSNSTSLEEISVRGIPEVLVEGARVLNADVARSRDDIQPYVIFDAETIERSGATSVEEFFRQRLPMNTTGGTLQQNGAVGNSSSINLRGLGTNQTLILVDGKRQSNTSFGGTLLQSDINNIPLSSIERIEILPTTASGLFGGGAIGGVVNIILRRDYEATELRTEYSDTFDGGGAMRKVDLLLGRRFREGKTNVMFSGSWSDQDSLLSGDRDFYERGLSAIRRNNPGYLDTWMPMGSTPNIRSVDGSPLFGPGSPSFTHVPAGYAGGGGLTPLQQHAGEYNFEQPNTVQGTRAPVYSGGGVRSATVTVRNEFTPFLSGFLDISASDNEQHTLNTYHFLQEFTLHEEAPNNPFGQPVRVRLPLNADVEQENSLEQQQISGGLIARLPRNWTGELDYSVHRATSLLLNGQRFDPTLPALMMTGVVDVLSDVLEFVDASDYINARDGKFVTQTHNAALRLSGPIGRLPAGRPMLNVLLENRRMRLGDGTRENALDGSRLVNYTTGKQDVDSIYLELTLPVISAANRIPGIEELELQLAARHDRYDIVSGPHAVPVGTPSPVATKNSSDSTDPTLGFKWQPIEDVTVRASYSTGFLPPDNFQVSSPMMMGIMGTQIVDPRRGNEVNTSYVTTLFGNPNLRPEESKSWSAGLVATPRVLPRLRLSLDYTNIKKSDTIVGYPELSESLLLANELSFPGRVIRGPADGMYEVGPVVHLDMSYLNAAKVDVEAWDLQADYVLQTESFGEFSWFALGTRQTKYEVQLLPSLPFRNTVGVTGAAPLEWRFNMGMKWRYGAWSAGWATRYLSSYLVADPALPASTVTFLNQGGSRVPSQLYHDAQVSYDIPFAKSWLAGAQVQLAINNILNDKPPLDVLAPHYYSSFGDPRLASYSLSLRMSF